MTINVDSLLPMPKLDCDGGYDAAVKGLSVVVAMSYPFPVIPYGLLLNGTVVIEKCPL